MATKAKDSPVSASTNLPCTVICAYAPIDNSRIEKIESTFFIGCEYDDNAAFLVTNFNEIKAKKENTPDQTNIFAT